MRERPGGPTKQERRGHAVIHLPYRSWCDHCVRGKAKERGHFRADREEEEDLSTKLPMVCMDYCFYSKGETDAERGPAILVVRDRGTKATCGHMVREKGIGDGWIVDRVVEDIENMGHSEITLKTDQEPAIRDLQRAVKEKRAPYKTILENSPVEASGSNGIAEKAVQELEGQVRAMRLALAARIGEMPAEASAVMAWMTEAAAQLINRHQVGKDGRTPPLREGAWEERCWPRGGVRGEGVVQTQEEEGVREVGPALGAGHLHHEARALGRGGDRHATGHAEDQELPEDGRGQPVGGSGGDGHQGIPVEAGARRRRPAT